MRSNDHDTIGQLAGTDMTYYFPPPLPLACPFLVADDANIQLEYKNFTPPVPLAIHTRGSNGATDDLKDPEWYGAWTNSAGGMKQKLGRLVQDDQTTPATIPKPIRKPEITLALDLFTTYTCQPIHRTQHECQP
ncbi:hypothetical protein BKA70DRAFT_1437417 [Coprinopsis sp. MPI-PUGE-AT-0042]|nr:hypothetical protein BKA70DRAFT_1437417 [Coprinopsis sp. MPI-PUGE-AT-0042]